MRTLGWSLVLLLAACRIESATPRASTGAADCARPAGDVWIYTSMYRHVVDQFDPVLKRLAPDVNVHWFQAGSEKVLARLEAELKAGGTQADVLLVSDPFLFGRLKDEGHLRPYVPPGALRMPRNLLDPDGAYAAARLSTMVLVHRKETDSPASFKELTDPRFKGKVVLGDPLASGTAFVWAVFLRASEGDGFFQALRDNEARLAGGNAAVLQKIEGGEAEVGVLLLENAIAARGKGSPIEIVWPSDGAVVVPGDAAIFSSTRNPAGAQAVVDAIFSSDGQRVIVDWGQMHSVDPRMPGPDNAGNLDELVRRSRPWTPAIERAGIEQGVQLKTSIQRVFSK